METNGMIAQLVGRQNDFMFESFSDLRKNAKAQQKRCREEQVKADVAFFTPEGLLSFGGIEVKPSGYTWQQIAKTVGLRRSDMSRLLDNREGKTDMTPHLMAICNELWPRNTGNDIKLLVDTQGKDQFARCWTGEGYTRIFDGQVCDVIDRWLAPSKDSGLWLEARPTINKRVNEDGSEALPAMFRGEQDMNVFFYTKREGDALDDFGGLRKGVVISNGETGVKPLSISTFVFREMCGNYLIWGMENLEEKSHRHVGNVNTFFKEVVEETLKNLSGTLDDAMWDELEVAANTEFAADPGKAQDRLIGQFNMPKAKAHAVVAGSLDEKDGTGDLSVWGIVNGMTALGRDPAYATDMVEIGAEARELMTVALAK